MSSADATMQNLFSERFWRRWCVMGALVCMAILLSPAQASAQEEGQEVVPLAATTQRTLVRLQEDWLRWLSASYRETGEAGEVVIDRLLATGDELDFQRFPDLNLGALQQAARAAREGEIDRATWILEFAERLDQGQPETAFAGAYVARLDGKWPQAVISEVSGYARVFAIPRQRDRWLANAVIWILWVLLLAAAAFVVVSFVAHGPQLYQDLASIISGPLPVLALSIVLPLLLLSPLALPQGLMFLLLLWSVLLWSYSSGTERAVLIFAWALTVIVPIANVSQVDRVVLANSQPARALAALTEGRLYGDLFRDLEALRERLPGDPAALQLEADLHQRIGQTQQARSLYRRVLETERENGPVLVNLGVQRFRQGDFGNAISYFQQAIAADPMRAEPSYNLSLAYSQTFAFDESQRALQDAKNKDNEQVAQWIVDSRSSIHVEGGIARIPEVRESLQAAGDRNGIDAVKLGMSLGTFVATLLAALAWSRLRQRILPGARFGQSVPSANRWLLAIVPGAQSVEVGSGILAFLQIMVPVGLLLLPFSRAVGCQMTWGFEPIGLMAWTVSAIGLSLLVLWKAKTIIQEGV